MTTCEECQRLTQERDDWRSRSEGWQAGYEAIQNALLQALSLLRESEALRETDGPEKPSEMRITAKERMA